MKKALLLLLFLAVFSRAIFGSESVYEIRKKAEAGDAVAQTKLGVRYALGFGVPKDSTEAAKWYRKSAEQGNADAQTYLGLNHDGGDVRKKAEAGDAVAQFNLGFRYDDARSLPKTDCAALAGVLSARGAWNRPREVRGGCNER